VSNERRPAEVPEDQVPQPATNRGTPGGEAEDVPGSGVPGGEAEEVPGSNSVAGSGSAEESAVQRDLDALESTKRERDEYLELAQRTRADFENYRKRVSAETQAASQRGKAELAKALLPVLDNLERAMEAADLGEQPEGALEQGILLTHRELRSALEAAGVEAVDPLGEKFDPEWHEAISTSADGAGEPGSVVDVLQKGYRIGEQLIRPARVVVHE
jgi:molecular chaperone GrpE